MYENDEYFSLIQVGKRKEKHSECRNKDLASISRRVQEHYKAKTADEVPSGYILAYSKLFRCSTDYLYGLIDIPAPDAETADICRKTGLSEKAVKNLMSGGSVFLDEFLWTADRYGLLERRPTDTTDNHNAEEDPEDEYLDTECSMTDFWNTILENDIFNMAPQAWYRMACAMYTCKGMKAIAEDYEATKDIIPPRETFLSQVEMHNIFHSEDRVYGYNELPIKERPV